MSKLLEAIDKLDEVHVLVARSQVDMEAYKEISVRLIEVKEKLRECNISDAVAHVTD